MIVNIAGLSRIKGWRSALVARIHFVATQLTCLLYTSKYLFIFARIDVIIRAVDEMGVDRVGLADTVGYVVNEGLVKEKNLEF